MALPLAGLLCCRAGRSGRGLWPAGTEDWAASRWSSWKSRRWKDGLQKAGAKFAPNFGCLLGWSTGLKEGLRSDLLSDGSAAGQDLTSIKNIQTCSLILCSCVPDEVNVELG